jgi:hypothetical protein
MNVSRPDVALARFPHASGGRGKKRPVVVVVNPQPAHQARRRRLPLTSTRSCTSTSTFPVQGIRNERQVSS